MLPFTFSLLLSNDPLILTRYCLFSIYLIDRKFVGKMYNREAFMNKSRNVDFNLVQQFLKYSLTFEEHNDCKLSINHTICLPISFRVTYLTPCLKGEPRYMHY